MIDSVVSSWWSWMVTTTWQVALLVVIIAIVDRLIRRWAWPQVRHALWLLVLIKLVIPPGWALPTAVIPVVGERLAGVVSGAGPAAAPAHDSAATAEAGTRSDLTSRGDSSGPRPSNADGLAPAGAPIPWRTVLFVVWLTGVVVFTALLVSRTTRLARWHREQDERPAIPEWFYDLLIKTSQRLGLSRVPAIVFSEEAVTPAVYGVFRPVLLLPAHYTESLDEQEAEHVLLHELAHLKRGDLLAQGALLILQVLYWFNPFVALARRRIKHVREICCDLTVASHLEEETVAYRKTLLDTARALLTESVQPSLGLLGVFEEPYRLVSRMHWLEQKTWRRHRIMLGSAAFVVFLAAPFVLPMASGVPHPTERNPVGTGVEAEPTSHAVSEFTVVRNEFREETLVFGLVVRSRRLANSHLWVGPNIISGTERNRTTVVDLERSMLTFIDHGNEVWIEAPLPLDVEPFLSEELQRARRRIRTTGKVEQSGDRKRILDRRCRAFDITVWNVSGGGVLSNEASFRVWDTTEVPFDLKMLQALLLNLRLIYNRDEAYRRELEKMPGLQMRLELRRGGFLSGTRLIDEVVEISRQAPPPDAFAPPKGYRQVEVLEELEL